MKIVVALGGNALGNNPQEQIKILDENMNGLAKLVEDGHQLVITHGNGPQVGIIQNAFEGNRDFKLELPEATAMTQAYIGYHIQQVLKNHLLQMGVDKNIVSLITQVVVDPKSKEFKNPTKPIGKFYSKNEAELYMKNSNIKMIEDAGRGYRKVVASPKPIDIVEKDIITSLLKNDNIVIACGGGGIPVYKKNGKQLLGMDAVVDKDFAAAKMADLIDADLLLILTAVSEVKKNFGQDDEENISYLSMDNAKKLIDSGELAAGSMLPKVEAALNFIEDNSKRLAIITSLDNIDQALKGERGTKIQKY